MRNLTDISIVLDRSGSMNSVKSDTIEGFNSFVNEQRKTTGECTVSLYQFDDKYETIYENRSVKDASFLNNETFIPRGWTCLLDAIGKTINSTGERLSKLSHEDRPSKVLICIITDGQENKSKEFTRNQVFEMIKHQREKYNWQFIFIGANQDAIATAKSYGIRSGSTLCYASNSEGTKAAFASLSSNVKMSREGTNLHSDFEEIDREIQKRILAKIKK